MRESWKIPLAKIPIAIATAYVLCTFEVCINSTITYIIATAIYSTALSAHIAAGNFICIVDISFHQVNG